MRQIRNLLPEGFADGMPLSVSDEWVCDTLFQLAERRSRFPYGRITYRPSLARASLCCRPKSFSAILALVATDDVVGDDIHRKR